ncbi:hypothetical protein [Demequina sediminis]|nr:hypothetical protein [Demequina sediminis]
MTFDVHQGAVSVAKSVLERYSVPAGTSETSSRQKVAPALPPTWKAS